MTDPSARRGRPGWAAPPCDTSCHHEPMSELTWQIVCESEHGPAAVLCHGSATTTEQGWSAGLEALLGALGEQRRRRTYHVTVEDRTAIVIPGLTPSGDLDLPAAERACAELALALTDPAPPSTSEQDRLS